MAKLNVSELSAEERKQLIQELQLADQLEAKKAKVTEALEALVKKEGFESLASFLGERKPSVKRGKRATITDELKASIIKDLKNGSTVNELVKKYPASSSTINNIKKAAGLTKSK